MKRIDSYTVQPEPGEILDFSEIYGKNAGEGMSLWRTFGRRGDNKNNPEAICIALEPFAKSETKFLISGASLYSGMQGERVLIVSPKPYAEPGDPDNVAEKYYGYKKSLDGLTFFVNDVNEPPQGKQYVTKWRGSEQYQEELDQGHWLRPGVQYYVTYARIGSYFGNPANMPLSLYVIGSDDVENGGERVLMPPIEQIEHDAEVAGELEEIQLAGRTGLVIWDK